MTGWAAVKELRGVPLPLETLVEYMYINWRKNAAPTALVERVETIEGEDPDVQPTDIEAETARPPPAQQKKKREAAQGDNARRQQREQASTVVNQSLNMQLQMHANGSET